MCVQVLSLLETSSFFCCDKGVKKKFAYTGIRVRDLKRSIEFYTKTMGMKEVQRGKMRAGGIFVQLRSKESEETLELNYYPPGKKYYEEYVEGSELDHLVFWCKDARRSYEKVLACGATSAVESWDEGGYTLAFVRVPDGAWIELIGKRVKPRSQKQELSFPSEASLFVLDI